jgi:hypothetical protein
MKVYAHDGQVLGLTVVISYVTFGLLAGPLTIEHFKKSLGLHVQDICVSLAIVMAVFKMGGYESHTYGKNEFIMNMLIIIMTPLIWGMSSKFESMKTDLQGILKNKILFPILIFISLVIGSQMAYIIDDPIKFGTKFTLISAILTMMYYLKHKDEELHIHHATLFGLLGVLFSQNHMVMRIAANVSIGSIVHGYAAYGYDTNIYHKDNKLSHNYKEDIYSFHDRQKLALERIEE